MAVTPAATGVRVRRVFALSLGINTISACLTIGGGRVGSQLAVILRIEVGCSEKGATGVKSWDTLIKLLRVCFMIRDLLFHSLYPVLQFGPQVFRYGRLLSSVCGLVMSAPPHLDSSDCTSPLSKSDGIPISPPRGLSTTKFPALAQRF